MKGAPAESDPTATTTAQPVLYRIARTLVLANLGITVGNCALVGVVGSEQRWRPTPRLEIVNTGTSIAILWTKSGGSSIAMDCLPGIVPQFKISRTRVFVDGPIWISLLVCAAVWGIARWRIHR